MCTFLAIAVPGGDLASVRSLCPRGLNVDPCSNESIAHIVGREFSAYWLTTSQCSCSLVPSDASMSHPGTELASLESKLRRRYASRGWSAAKTERAIADAVAAARTRGNEGLREDAAAFLSALCERFDRLRLVAHFFSGALDCELDLRAGGQLDLEGLTIDAIELDRCYDLSSGAANTLSGR